MSNLNNYLSVLKEELEQIPEIERVIIGFTTPDKHGLNRWGANALVSLVLPATITVEEFSYNVNLSILVYFFENNPETATTRRLSYIQKIQDRLCLCFERYKDNISLELQSIDIKDGIRYMGESDNIINISNPLHAVSMVYAIRINEMRI